MPRKFWLMSVLNSINCAPRSGDANASMLWLVLRSHLGAVLVCILVLTYKASSHAELRPRQKAHFRDHFGLSTSNA